MQRWRRPRAWRCGENDSHVRSPGHRLHLRLPGAVVSRAVRRRLGVLNPAKVRPAGRSGIGDHLHPFHQVAGAFKHIISPRHPGEAQRHLLAPAAGNCQAPHRQDDLGVAGRGAAVMIAVAGVERCYVAVRAGRQGGSQKWTPFFGPRNAEIKLGFQVLLGLCFVAA